MSFHSRAKGSGNPALPWMRLTPSAPLPMARERTSLTLEDVTILRATSPAVLLQGLGRRLRTTVGGIGMAGDERSGDEEYAKSEQVDAIDLFLSHSWHAPWFLKYLSLLCYFNAGPSLWVVAVAAAIFFLAGKSMHFCQAASWYLQALLPIMTSVVYFFLFVFWSGIAVTIPWFRTKIFLDKVCIHQTDMKKKERGIKSIGALLQKSNEMLLIWDSSYFTRLWCVYELSAFRKSKPTANIHVVPVRLGLFCTFGLVASLIKGIIKKFSGQRLPPLLTLALESTCTMALVIMVQMFFREVSKLSDRLGEFDVRRAGCFCCDCDHVHPTSHELMMCDRKLVYESIGHWYGNDDIDEGLKNFNESIARHLLASMSNLTGLMPVPLAAATLCGVPAFIHYSIKASSCEAELCEALRPIHCLFIRAPASTIVLLLVGRVGHRWFKTRLGKTLWCLVPSFVYTMCWQAVKYLEGGRWDKDFATVWKFGEPDGLVRVCRAWGSWSSGAKVPKTVGEVLDICESAVWMIVETSVVVYACRQRRKIRRNDPGWRDSEKALPANTELRAIGEEEAEMRHSFTEPVLRYF